MTCCQKIRKNFLYKKILNIWYNPLPWYLYLLKSLSYLFNLIIFIRKCYYKKIQQKISVPVIIVGNITVGGNGKTPVVIEVVNFLKQHGFHPGIISRGYMLQKQSSAMVHFVSCDSDPNVVGDEAVLLAKATNVPVAVGSNRVLVAKDLLAQNTNIDIIVSDDGLQHYKLARDIEIAIVDPKRAHGNGELLPLGPLREPITRLQEVDIVVNVQKAPVAVVNLKNPNLQYNFSDFINRNSGKSIHAIAAIANPESFFDLLEQSGISVIKHSYPDHYQYSKADVSFVDALDVIMTEKDAIKCVNFAGENYWFVRIKAQLPNEFYVKLLKLLEYNNG